MNSRFLSEEIRAIGLGMLDRVRGGKLHASVAEIRNHAQHPGRLREARADRLKSLLRDSSCRTRFYSEYQGRVSFADFPVVRKETIRSRKTDFLATGFSPRALTSVTTSGSSGEPFECFHDPAKRVRKLADLMYFNGLAGYRVGMRHLLMRATPKGKLKQWVQNQVWVDPTRWDDQLRESVRKQLLEGEIRVAIGYPSVLADIAEHCLAKGDEPDSFGLHAFISTSELISPQQRDVIGKAFKCRVISRYATEEVGVIGQTAEDCGRFALNTGSLIVEVLREDGDEAVQVGEVGRVVVTDLFLRAMPLIRYETGDLARVEEESPDGLGVESLSSLEGKTTQVIYDTTGRMVAPLAILVAFKQLEGSVSRFQFCQKSRDHYELRLCGKAGRTDPIIEMNLKRILGADAKIHIKNVNAISPLPSGKRPVVVNEMVRDEAAV